MESLVVEVMGNRRTPATLWMPEAFAKLAKELRSKAEAAGLVLPDLTKAGLLGSPLSYGTLETEGSNPYPFPKEGLFIQDT